MWGARVAVRALLFFFVPCFYFVSASLFSCGDRLALAIDRSSAGVIDTMMSGVTRTVVAGCGRVMLR
jgi:hypothetical protein